MSRRSDRTRHAIDGRRDVGTPGYEDFLSSCVQRETPMKRPLSHVPGDVGGLAAILAGPAGRRHRRPRPPRDASATTVYRDDFGIPHVYAPTLEDAAYGIGYAQAEDRLEELLKNYRRAAGTMAEVFGPQFYQDDLAQRIWRHAEIGRSGYPRLSPKLRAVLEAYVAGVKRFMAEHPEQVPAWAQEIHPWDSVALGRYIICWGWPSGRGRRGSSGAGRHPAPPRLPTAARTRW